MYNDPRNLLIAIEEVLERADGLEYPKCNYEAVFVMLADGSGTFKLRVREDPCEEGNYIAYALGGWEEGYTATEQEAATLVNWLAFGTLDG